MQPLEPGKASCEKHKLYQQVRQQTSEHKAKMHAWYQKRKLTRVFGNESGAA